MALSTSKLISGAAVFWLFILDASDVFACASCTGATPEPVRQAYNYSTAWLSFIPLIFMGSVGYTIYRMIKRGKAEEQ